MHWTTFKGKSVSLTTIDHQHLSNCYWFSRIINNLPVYHRHLTKIRTELSNRFNGQLLKYRPHIDFDMEIEYLRDNDLLVEVNNNPYHLEIWFNGDCIGEIIYPVA